MKEILMQQSRTSSTVVVLGTFNPSEFLEDQLVSILNQTNPDVDIYVSDDCSDQKSDLENVKKKFLHLK
jgi:glycosyltransferase involved in cell wall biosynthesis